jgi:hypothetical protein
MPPENTASPVDPPESGGVVVNLGRDAAQRNFVEIGSPDDRKRFL